MVETPPPPPAAGPGAPVGRRRRWRSLLRGLHRDAGYLAVGLTFVYALSGLAVNHIKDWDPNFRQVVKEVALPANLPTEDQALARVALKAFDESRQPRDIYRVDEKQLDVIFDNLTIHVDPERHLARSEGQDARFLLRVANWLHLNRGKKAWTYIADGYAVFLLFLAVSGLFMLPGRAGLLGRGGLLAVLGAGLPIAYVLWSGGP